MRHINICRSDARHLAACYRAKKKCNLLPGIRSKIGPISYVLHLVF